MKTVKVKVAVAVDRTGGWCAAGWTDSKDDERIEISAPDVPAINRNNEIR